MSREAILGKVRSSLGRKAGAPPPPPPAVRLTPPERDLETRIVQFRAALEALAAKTVVVASQADADAYVDSVVAGRRTCGMNSTREEVAAAEVGVTGADYGLADTGSLVMLACTDPRLVSLLPPLHIAVLPVARLLTGLDELLTIVPMPADQTSSMVLITGPSRTADIEQILIRGVHGPGELHVVLTR